MSQWMYVVRRLPNMEPVILAVRLAESYLQLLQV